MSDVAREVVQASQTGQPVRIHKTDGEVLVARVLAFDENEVVCAVLTSSRPENYAVCDSTGFAIEYSRIEQIRLLQEPKNA